MAQGVAGCWIPRSFLGDQPMVGSLPAARVGSTTTLEVGATVHNSLTWSFFYFSALQPIYSQPIIVILVWLFHFTYGNSLWMCTHWLVSASKKLSMGLQQVLPLLTRIGITQIIAKFALQLVISDQWMYRVFYTHKILLFLTNIIFFRRNEINLCLNKLITGESQVFFSTRP